MTLASTYRLQLHAGFGFAAATAIVEYLDELGITHAYASPYLAAQKGSTHGYDLVDPKRLNPELGTEDDYRAWTDALKSRGMSHIVDFVPNHMAASPANAWWRDVLENGPASAYADHFDIEWRSPKEGLRGKVLLPVLGAQYGEVLEKGELVLARDGGHFEVRYWERAFPLDPATVAPLLERAVAILDLPAEEPRRQDLESVAHRLGRLGKEAPADREREKEVAKRRLADLAVDPVVCAAIDAEVTRINGTPGKPETFDELDALLVAQPYRLAYWRVASDEINYRRFFEVNDLAAIRMEDAAVFDDMHELLFRLIDEGRIDGVRLDHVDGLYDPVGYFEKLRARVKGIWIGAEKILSHGESLPASWPIEGTTGYEWLATVNSLLVDPRGEEGFTRVYRELTGDARVLDEHVQEAKRTVLRSSLASELQMLALRLERIANRDRRSRDFTLATLRRALGETIASFPVYRTYVRPDGTRDAIDERILSRALRLARRRNPVVSPSVFAFIKDTLLFDPRTAAPDKVELAMRFQQLTGPVTAKGVEDTAFYTYVRFVGLNEVGGEPSRFGTSIAAFHAANAENLARRPRTMTTTSTHDTKRGEDVRARLAVLAEMPDVYARWIREWEAIATKHVTALDEDTRAPSASDRLLFFQTAIGAYPLEARAHEAFPGRVADYMVKAAREAKRDTSWLSPDDAYESALRAFVTGILADEELAASLASKAAAIATYGASNGLAQVLLKVCSPGIPDTYQGSETWDLRLVDPDNRTPVDYDALARLVRASRDATPAELVESFRDGRLKLRVVSRALRLRRERPALFLEGEYRPIDAGDEIVAFTRTHETETLACAVTRLPWHATGGGKASWATGLVWGDRRLPLPAGTWRNLLDDRVLTVGSEGLAASELFLGFPVALLVGESLRSQ